MAIYSTHLSLPSREEKVSDNTYEVKTIYSLLEESKVHNLTYNLIRSMPLSTERYCFHLQLSLPLGRDREITTISRLEPNVYTFPYRISSTGITPILTQDGVLSSLNSRFITGVSIQERSGVYYGRTQTIYNNYYAIQRPLVKRPVSTLTVIDTDANNASCYSNQEWLDEPNVLISRVQVLFVTPEVYQKHGVEERWFVIGNTPLALYYWLWDRDVSKAEYDTYIKSLIDSTLNLPIVLVDLICQY